MVLSNGDHKHTPLSATQCFSSRTVWKINEIRNHFIEGDGSYPLSSSGRPPPVIWERLSEARRNTEQSKGIIHEAGGIVRACVFLLPRQVIVPAAAVMVRKTDNRIGSTLSAGVCLWCLTFLSLLSADVRGPSSFYFHPTTTSFYNPGRRCKAFLSPGGRTTSSSKGENIEAKCWMNRRLYQYSLLLSLCATIFSLKKET